MCARWDIPSCSACRCRVNNSSCLYLPSPPQPALAFLISPSATCRRKCRGSHCWLKIRTALYGVHNQETQNAITCRNRSMLSILAIRPRHARTRSLSVDAISDPWVIGPLHSLCMRIVVLRDTSHHGGPWMPAALRNRGVISRIAYRTWGQ